MVLLYSFFSVCPQITFWRFYEKPPNGRKVWRQVYHRPRYFGLNHDHIWFWRVGILKMSYPNGRKFWSIVYLWPRYFGLGASIALAQNLAPPTGRHGWHVFATLVCPSVRLSIIHPQAFPFPRVFAAKELIFQFISVSLQCTVPSHLVMAANNPFKSNSNHKLFETIGQ